MADKPKASLDDIDYRTRVGSEAWQRNNDPAAARLSAWRRLHMLLPHAEVAKLAKPTDSPDFLANVVRQVEAKQKK